MYDFNASTFPGIYDADRRIKARRQNELARYVRDGNLVMLRHFAGASAKIESGSLCRVGNPLYRACQGGHEHLVKFLLDRNAKYDDDVLFKAIRVGNTKILRRLLDYDATVHNEDYGFPSQVHVLSEIVLAENMAILELVIKKGYRVTRERHEDAMKSAIANGLESMVERLGEINIVN